MLGTCGRGVILLVLAVVSVSGNPAITALQADVAALQAGLNTANAAIAALEADVAALQADLTAANAENAGLRANQTRAVGFALRNPKPATGNNLRMNFSGIFTNEYNAWNATSAQFTCTVPGVYYFHASLAKPSGYNGPARCRIRKNGATLVTAYLNSGTTDNVGYYNFGNGAYVKLVLNDNVTLDDCIANVANMAHTNSAFSGFLVTPTY